ncbi:hypothetical protein, partial [Serratia proteamaculans]|uniref:hypothetical protein n=1 Tax=Serratia proteamaculans TaxID=28151 RepID=UPI0039AF1228
QQALRESVGLFVLSVAYRSVRAWGFLLCAKERIAAILLNFHPSLQCASHKSRYILRPLFVLIVN